MVKGPAGTSAMPSGGAGGGEGAVEEGGVTEALALACGRSLDGGGGGAPALASASVTSACGAQAASAKASASIRDGSTPALYVSARVLSSEVAAHGVAMVGLV